MKRLSLALLFILLLSPAKASDIRIFEPFLTDPGVGCSLRLDGQILPGDADRLMAIVEETVGGLSYYGTSRIEEQIVLCLSGPGGSFSEALKIADVVFDMNIVTKVEPGASCLSACAVAFMAGRFETYSGVGAFPSRYMHPTSTLGFHAPALVLPEGQFTRDDVQRAYSVAIEAVGLIMNRADRLRIDQGLLTGMVSNTGSSFFYISTVDHIARFRIDLYGYDAPPISTESSINACWNTFRWQFWSYRTAESQSEFQSFVDSTFRDTGGVLAYEPFDGTMLCKHGIEAFGGGDVERIQQSEYSDFRDVTIDVFAEEWVRYPGPTPLKDLLLGTLRDFAFIG